MLWGKNRDWLGANKRQVGGRFSPAGDIQFVKNIVHMIFDRTHLNEELIGNLLIGQALAN
jgi:hypothetical protein